MCEAGRIKHHLKNNIGNPKNLILVVGFMAEGTRGRDIVQGKRKIRLFGELYPLKAEVVVINAFSAHADKLELLDYVRNIRGLENIFIVHAEESECSVMRDNLINILKLRCRIDIADMGEEFEVNKNGTQSNLGKRREVYLRELDNLNK
jgi:metallo-beta-lactamase family protein